MTVQNWVDDITRELRLASAHGEGQLSDAARRITEHMEKWLRDCMDESGIADRHIEGTDKE